VRTTKGTQGAEILKLHYQKMVRTLPGGTVCNNKGGKRDFENGASLPNSWRVLERSDGGGRSASFGVHTDSQKIPKRRMTHFEA